MSTPLYQRAIDRYRDGKTYVEIAAELKCSRSYVAKALSKWRAGQGVKEREGELRLALTGSLAARLAVVAEERGVHVRALVRDILTNVAEDDLYDAVLDR